MINEQISDWGVDRNQLKESQLIHGINKRLKKAGGDMDMGMGRKNWIPEFVWSMNKIKDSSSGFIPVGDTEVDVEHKTDMNPRENFLLHWCCPKSTFHI